MRKLSLCPHHLATQSDAFAYVTSCAQESSITEAKSKSKFKACLSFIFEFIIKACLKSNCAALQVCHSSVSIRIYVDQMLLCVIFFVE